LAPLPVGTDGRTHGRADRAGRGGRLPAPGSATRPEPARSRSIGTDDAPAAGGRTRHVAGDRFAPARALRGTAHRAPRSRADRNRRPARATAVGRRSVTGVTDAAGSARCNGRRESSGTFAHPTGEPV